MVCIGYAGIEVFDLILYIGRTLTKLNYRVLIIDLSDIGALMKAIKHGMNLNSIRDIVNYRDINYTRKIPDQEELEPFKDAVVLIVYGFNYTGLFPLACKKINIITNTFPHVIDEITPILQKAASHEERVEILIRDVVKLDDVDSVKDNLALPAKAIKADYLYLDIADYESALDCQISQIVRFTKISARMEKYIENQIHDIFPGIKLSKVKKAIAAARRGK